MKNIFFIFCFLFGISLTANSQTSVLSQIRVKGNLYLEKLNPGDTFKVLIIKDGGIVDTIDASYFINGDGIPIIVKNGLYKDGDTIKLGGELTESTFIEINNNPFAIGKFDDNDNNNSILFLGFNDLNKGLVSIGIGAIDGKDEHSSIIRFGSGGGLNDTRDTEILIISAESDYRFKNVLENVPIYIYGEDDNGYLVKIETSEIGGGEDGNIIAKNGLYKQQDSIKLGGTLTEDTEIVSTNNKFTINVVDSTQYLDGSLILRGRSLSSSANSNGNGVVITSGNYTDYSSGVLINTNNTGSIYNYGVNIAGIGNNFGSYIKGISTAGNGLWLEGSSNSANKAGIMISGHQTNPNGTSVTINTNEKPMLIDGVPFTNNIDSVAYIYGERIGNKRMLKINPSLLSGGGSSSILVNNGLSYNSTLDTVQLGGTLIKNTNIVLNNVGMTIRDTVSGHGLHINSSDSTIMPINMYGFTSKDSTTGFKTISGIGTVSDNFPDIMFPVHGVVKGNPLDMLEGGTSEIGSTIVANVFDYEYDSELSDTILLYHFITATALENGVTLSELAFKNKGEGFNQVHSYYDFLNNIHGTAVYQDNYKYSSATFITLDTDGEPIAIHTFKVDTSGVHFNNASTGSMSSMDAVGISFHQPTGLIGIRPVEQSGISVLYAPAKNDTLAVKSDLLKVNTISSIGSFAPDCSMGNVFHITGLNEPTLSLGLPTNMVNGAEIKIRINVSGITSFVHDPSYKWTEVNPANLEAGNMYEITIRYFNGSYLASLLTWD